MPQDIPLEASETLVFTPASLSNIDGAPTFTLKSPTRRDERQHRRLMREQGQIRHSDEALRNEFFKGLEALWDEAAFERHEPIVRAYYEAREQFVLQRREDPEIVWEYDPAIEQAVNKLLVDVTREWAPLAKMAADNAEYNEMVAPLTAAIVVASWTGLDVKRERERGRLTVDCAEALVDALDVFEAKHKEEHSLVSGVASTELYIACMSRLYLDEEEAGNSGSPSQSTAAPQNSSTTSARGKSKGRASSTKTRETV